MASLVVPMRTQDLAHITPNDVMTALRSHGKSRGQVMLPKDLFGGSQAARARLVTARPGVTFVWTDTVVPLPAEICPSVPTARIWRQRLLLKRVLECLGPQLRDKCRVVRGDAPWDGEVTIQISVHDAPMLWQLGPEFTEAGLALARTHADDRCVIRCERPNQQARLDVVVCPFF